MTTIPHYEVRRRLLNMRTTDIETFGCLTVRLYIAQDYVRWQIDSPFTRQSYRYPVYSMPEYGFSDVDQIGIRNETLAKATAFIVANYQGEVTAPKIRLCEICGVQLTLRSLKARFCGDSCRRVHNGRTRQARIEAQRSA